MQRRTALKLKYVLRAGGRDRTGGDGTARKKLKYQSSGESAPAVLLSMTCPALCRFGSVERTAVLQHIDLSRTSNFQIKRRVIM